MGETRIASVSGLRGVVGDGFDPIVAVEFAAAYASLIDSPTILVGHDGRASASTFSHAVSAAIAATGRDVLFCGPIATPTLGFLAKERHCGAVQISASHNPAEYNGLKFFQTAGMVLSPAQGRELLSRVERREFAWSAWNAQGRVRDLIDPDETHIARVLKFVDVERIRNRAFRVVLDACHGGGGRSARKLLDALGCRTLAVGETADGLYDHPPEPLEDNLRGLSAIASAVGADLACAQDPDADRLAILDESGAYIGEESTLALAVKHRLEHDRGPIVLNLSTSRVAEDLAVERGCPVFRAPVGEVHVVERLIAEKGILGGEGNGGVIDPRVGFVRDSLVAIAWTLDLLAESGRKLSEIVAELPKYAMIKTKFPTGALSVPLLLERIAESCPEATANRADGLRLDWPDRWAHVRASNTEPIVRVIAEALDSRAAQTLADRLGRVVLESQSGRSAAGDSP